LPVSATSNEVDDDVALSDEPTKPSALNADSSSWMTLFAASDSTSS